MEKLIEPTHKEQENIYYFQRGDHLGKCFSLRNPIKREQKYGIWAKKMVQ